MDHISMLVGWTLLILQLAIGLCGLVGAIFAAATREDAFRAGDRQNKMVWVAMLIGSAIVVAMRLPFVNWIGMVVIGLYWWDVRPQLNRIVRGEW